ncbi:MAG: ATP-binding protein [Methanobacterium sp.]|jgi:predicted HTH transcriptional regulator
MKKTGFKEVKGFKEEFAKLVEDPDRIKFREFIKQSTGEYPHIDFKEIWQEDSKVAKDVLGFSNSGGGALIIGVKEETDKSLTPVGIDPLKDKTNIKSKLANYLPSDLKYEILDFVYGNDVEWDKIKNKKFQVLIVEDTPEYLPFISLKSYDTVLYKNKIYYRGKTNTEEATHEEVKKILNRRLDTNVSTTAEDEFKEHIQQLKVLYSFVDEYYMSPSVFEIVSTLSSKVRNISLGIMKEKNPNYPEEDFEDVIIKMIERKKKIIENLITVR